jgi:hypothetical protein
MAKRKQKAIDYTPFIAHAKHAALTTPLNLTDFELVKHMHEAWSSYPDKSWPERSIGIWQITFYRTYFEAQYGLWSTVAQSVNTQESPQHWQNYKQAVTA